MIPMNYEVEKNLVNFITVIWFLIKRENTHEFPTISKEVSKKQ